MNPTKQQWADIENRAGQMFRAVNLICDGYLVSTEVQRDKMKLNIAVYVNGYIRGKDMWFGKESEMENMGEIARKFHRRFVRKPNAKELKQWEAIIGKRECKKRGYYDAHIGTMPYFNNAKSFIAHIKKYCESIEEISFDEYKKRLAELEAANAA